jgi:hypothetical protein
VKDGSGALYDFAGQGQNHKSRANNLTRSEEERRSKRKDTQNIQNTLIFSHNPLKFKREGSRVKNLDGLQNSLILR